MNFHSFSPKCWSLLKLLKIYGEPFARSVDLLAQLMFASDDTSNVKSLSPEVVEQVKSHLAELLDVLDNLQAPLSQKAINRLLSEVDVSFKKQRLNTLVLDIRRRLWDELEAASLFALEQGASEYYERGGAAFGDVVQGKFPELAFDLDEAAKCLALDRHTACVFHLMRAMELSVRSLAVQLRATVTDKHDKFLVWGVVVSNIKDKIELLQDTKRKEALLELHSYLHDVNIAFRSKTAHPERVYTKEEAVRAFDATKYFLPHLAQHLDELEAENGG